MPIPKQVNKDFFKKWTPEMAYVLGFFAADGYITVNKRGGQFWSIQITDLELLRSIRAVLKSEHTIGERRVEKNEKTLYRLQIGSVGMCDDLRTLGLRERKAKGMSLPHVPSRYLQDFVRGYFEGDGNIWCGLYHKDRKTQTPALTIVFTSCSVPFLMNLKARLNGICHGGCLYKSKRNYARLQYGTKDSLKLYDFMYNHSDYKKNGLFLERKRVVLEKYKRLVRP